MKRFVVALSCAIYGVAAPALPASSESASPPRSGGATVVPDLGSSLSASGSGLSAQGGSLSGSVSRLGATETQFGTVVSLSADVLFDFDKAQVKAAAMPKLRELRDFIKQRHPKQVQIHGHTDAIGGDAYNQRLSLRRADAVADWLAANGISRAVMVTRGFGERAPVAPNHKPDGSDDPEGRQKNRRVDVLLAKTFVPIRPIQLPR